MKFNFLQIFILSICFVSNSYSQSEKEILDAKYANWILATTSYIENNGEIIPKVFNHWMINSFYPYPSDRDKYESFNGSILKFLKENYNESFTDGKLFFVQKYSSIYHGNNKPYAILDESNLRTEISRKYREQNIWESDGFTSFDFKEFEKKFDAFNDFETCNGNNSGLYYYLITEFDKDSVRIKILDSGCGLTFD